MTGDADFTRWLGRYMRQSVSRNEIVPLLMTNFAYALPECSRPCGCRCSCSTAAMTRWRRWPTPVASLIGP